MTGRAADRVRLGRGPPPRGDLPRPVRRGRPGRPAPHVRPAALRAGRRVAPLDRARLRSRLVQPARADVARPLRRAGGPRPGPAGHDAALADGGRRPATRLGPPAGRVHPAGRQPRGLGPHGLGHDRRPRRADPDPGDLRRGVQDPRVDRADGAGRRCRRPRPGRRRDGSPFGPTSSIRWTTSTTRSTSTGSRRRSWPPAATGRSSTRVAPPLSPRVRGRGRRGRGPRRRRLAGAATARRGRTGCPGASGTDLFRATLTTRRRPMTRTVFKGGRLFDGTGAAPGRLATSPSRTAGSSGVGTGLDGDEAVDLEGRTILPGLFDCHVHVTVSDVDLWASRPAAVLAPVLRGRPEPRGDAPDRDHERPRRRRRRPRDQGGGRRRAAPGPADADLARSC